MGNENEGVAPDVEVEMTPKAVIAGHDPQLEKAVELILAALAEQPPMTIHRPKPANRVGAATTTKGKAFHQRRSVEPEIGTGLCFYVALLSRLP
ncbi:MAG: hypothetical protein R2867_44885 [Caldilineaceae bacterium]